MEGDPTRGYDRWHGSLNDRKRGKFARKAEVQWTSLWRAACCPRYTKVKTAMAPVRRLWGCKMHTHTHTSAIGANYSPANTRPKRFSLSWGAFCRAETASTSTSSGVAQAVSLYSLTVIPLLPQTIYLFTGRKGMMVVETCAIYLGKESRAYTRERVFVRTDWHWLTVCCWVLTQ